MTRVLVAYASKRGGTGGIAEAVADRLREDNLDVDLSPAGKARSFRDYDAVVLGSALYAGRWQSDAIRALRRLAKDPQHPPVWIFHSGPLGDEGASKPQKLPGKVAALAEKVGAPPVETIGGRLEPDAKGFIASKMTKNVAGDWRDPEQIRAFADRVAAALRVAG
jgi:menaquinone-dependent protoporphyrinogen oxidase